MTYALAIFDFDGTLADSWPWFLGQLDTMADRFGFRRPAADEVDALRKLSSREVLAALQVPLWKLPTIAAAARTAALADAEHIALFPGIDTMLRDLKAHGIRLAIASSNDGRVIRRVLGDDLSALFDGFACGASMFGKAQHVRRLLKALKVAHAQAVLIGDESRDVDAASAAGIHAAVVRWGYADIDALGGDALIARFDTPQDVVATLTAG